MARSPLRFRKSDVVRAVNSARAAGLVVVGVKIAPDNSIEVIAQDNAGMMPISNANPWDEVYVQKATQVLPRLH